MKREKLEKRKKVVMSLLRHPQYKPMRVKEIAMVFQLPKGRRKELYPVLDALVEEGQAMVDRRGRYEAADQVSENKKRRKKEETDVYRERRKTSISRRRIPTRRCTWTGYRSA